MSRSFMRKTACRPGRWTRGTAFWRSPKTTRSRWWLKSISSISRTMVERASGEQQAKSRKFVVHCFLLAASCLLMLNGCAPKRQVVINPAFDFSKVHRISVMPLDGPGGPAATDELVKALVGTGIEVTDAKHPGDLVLKGSVTEYKPNMQLMVFIGNDD